MPTRKGSGKRVVSEGPVVMLDLLAGRHGPWRAGLLLLSVRGRRAVPGVVGRRMVPRQGTAAQLVRGPFFDDHSLERVASAFVGM
jgi:hypothetical protein